MDAVSISELYEIAKTYQNYERRQFMVRGRLRSVEDEGAKGALRIVDGTCDKAVRIAVQRYFMPSSCGNNTFEQVNEAVDRGALANYDAVVSCEPGTELQATGVLVLTPNGPEPFELWSHEVDLLQER